MNHLRSLRSPLFSIKRSFTSFSSSFARQRVLQVGKTFQQRQRNFFSLVGPSIGSSSIPLAAFSLFAIAACQEEKKETQNEEFLTNEQTGVVFPKKITDGFGFEEIILGHGLRLVTFFKFHIYVVGLYVVPSTSLLSLARNNDSPGEFAQKLVENQEIPKSVAIYATRDIAGSHLRDGMEKALNEYFKLITDPEEKEKAQQDMTIFKSLFPKGQIKKNEHMIFSVRNNKMVIQFRNQIVGEIDSTFLCEKLFQCYVGEKALTEQVRTSILSGIESFLQGLKN